MTPIIRWAGSKRYLATHLIPQFPVKIERYIEPFCGSASLFFILEPAKSILSDINTELINTLNLIRTNHASVMSKYSSLADDRELFYVIRALNPNALTKTERAARFLYLNRLCFNGLYRTNKEGLFNVPYSGQKNAKSLSPDDIKCAAKVLKHSKLNNDDFKVTVSNAERNDFLYIDPPYASLEKTVFCEYSAKPFSVNDLGDLLDGLEEADKRGVKFMLSYTDCKEINRFKKHWDSKTIQVKRNIAGFAGHRKTASEVVIKNY